MISKEHGSRNQPNVNHNLHVKAFSSSDQVIKIIRRSRGHNVSRRNTTEMIRTKPLPRAQPPDDPWRLPFAQPSEYGHTNTCSSPRILLTEYTKFIKYCCFGQFFFFITICSLIFPIPPAHDVGPELLQPASEEQRPLRWRLL